jgi:hypothetical protein
VRVSTEPAGIDGVDAQDGADAEDGPDGAVGG